VGSDTVNYAFLQVYVSDPDGSCDVKSAFFNSFNPNGYPNQYNPYLMYDDGNIQFHGDTIPNDNRFSLIVEIKPNPSDTSLGYFRFDFFGKDRSDSVSNALKDSILIFR
jgi:hypothetical protein